MDAAWVNVVNGWSRDGGAEPKPNRIELVVSTGAGREGDVKATTIPRFGEADFLTAKSSCGYTYESRRTWRSVSTSLLSSPGTTATTVTVNVSLEPSPNSRLMWSVTITVRVAGVS